jgi:hypothetical protein
LVWTIIDALFVSCPLCGHRLEAQELFIEVPADFPAPARADHAVWQKGSEHYVEAHGIVSPLLLQLVRELEP